MGTSATQIAFGNYFILCTHVLDSPYVFQTYNDRDVNKMK
jgi:hypothetical protein